MNRYGRLHSLTVSLAPMHVVLWRLASLIAERTGVQVEVPLSSPILIDVCTEHLGILIGGNCWISEIRPSHSVRSSLSSSHPSLDPSLVSFHTTSGTIV